MIGPGPLLVPSPLPLATNLVEMVERTVREACVEETLSVVAAARMRDGAVDPAVQHVLDGIIRDEIRHVQLAWRTAHWAAQVGGAPARARMRLAFREAIQSGTDIRHRPQGHLEAWGCVGDDELRRVIEAARIGVLDEAAERLCG